MIKAILKNYRQSPRKVRVVSDLIKGKKVEDAILILDNTPKRASAKLVGLIESAAANAKNNFNLDRSSLIIKNITIDGGVVLKRIMPVSRGMAHPIKKRTSHVTVYLESVKSPQIKNK